MSLVIDLVKRILSLYHSSTEAEDTKQHQQLELELGHTNDLKEREKLVEKEIAIDRDRLSKDEQIRKLEEQQMKLIDAVLILEKEIKKLRGADTLTEQRIVQILTALQKDLHVEEADVANEERTIIDEYKSEKKTEEIQHAEETAHTPQEREQLEKEETKEEQLSFNFEQQVEATEQKDTPKPS